MKTIKFSFRPEVVKLKTKDLLFSKEVRSRARKHRKYLQIAASLRAVGLIEPLVVFPNRKGRYRVLDGNKRLDILRSQNAEEVDCLIGTSDEGYNYNRRVSYLSTISEHQMILRALRHNSAQTIATALNVNVSTIKRKRALLTGICEEAVDVLKDRRVPSKTFAVLRKMKPVRQLAAAQLMVASNVYSTTFAEALLVGTSDDLLVRPPKSSKVKSLSNEERARLISETDSVLRNHKMVEATYGQDALVLSVCSRFIQRMLSNERISAYLGTKHSVIRAELESLISLFNEESVHTNAANAP